MFFVFIRKENIIIIEEIMFKILLVGFFDLRVVYLKV